MYEIKMPEDGWSLRFVLEDEEAWVRLCGIEQNFRSDPNVRNVEVSYDQSTPSVYTLRVCFHEGKQGPFGQDLQQYKAVHGERPSVRRSKYERLLDNKDFFDS